MTTGTASTFARAITWLAVGISAVLLLLGSYRYGLSLDVSRRFWADIFDRLHGPMTFRFYLQPIMAAIAAFPDGIRDARFGRASFFWSPPWNSEQKRGRLREGLFSTARIILLGLSMDVIYQFKVFDRFYPAEAVVMAILLAVIPYFIFRTVVEFIARWWFRHRSPGPAS